MAYLGYCLKCGAKHEAEDSHRCMCGGEIEPAELVDSLAALEHQQWMHWSQHVAENNEIPDELREKWEKNWHPYSTLDEETQDQDRKWACEALQRVRSHTD